MYPGTLNSALHYHLIRRCFRAIDYKSRMQCVKCCPRFQRRSFTMKFCCKVYCWFIRSLAWLLGHALSHFIDCSVCRSLSFIRSLVRSVTVVQWFSRANVQSVIRSVCHSVSLSFGQSVIRSVGHSVGHSVGRSVGQSVIRSVGHSLGRSVGQLASRSVIRSVIR